LSTDIGQCCIENSKITDFVNELLRNPSDGFVKLIVSKLDLVGDRRVNANVVARFEPIVKKAIKAALLDIVTRPPAASSGRTGSQRVST